MGFTAVWWTAMALAAVPLDLQDINAWITVDPAQQRVTAEIHYDVEALAPDAALEFPTTALELMTTRVAGTPTTAVPIPGGVRIPLGNRAAGQQVRVEVTLRADRAVHWQRDKTGVTSAWSSAAAPVVPAVGASWDVSPRTIQLTLPQAWHAASLLPVTADQPAPQATHTVTLHVDRASTSSALPWAAGAWTVTRLAPNVEVAGTPAVTAEMLPWVTTATTRLRALWGAPPAGTLRLVVVPDAVLWDGPALPASALVTLDWGAHPRTLAQPLTRLWLANSAASPDDTAAATQVLVMATLQDVLGHHAGVVAGWPLLTQPTARAWWQLGCVQGEPALATALRALQARGTATVVPSAAPLGPFQATLEALPQGAVMRLTPPASTQWRAHVGGQDVVGPVLDGVSTLPTVPGWWVVDEQRCVGPDAPRLPLDAAVLAAQQASTPAARARALEALAARPDVLVTALNPAQDVLVREAAARTLAQVAQGPAQVRALEQALADKSPAVVAAAAQGLCTQGDVTTARALARVAGAPGDVTAREAAARSLGCHVKDTPDLVARALALGTPDAAVERATVAGICQLDANHPALLPVLTRGAPGAFETAARCVAVTRARAAVLGALWARLKDGSARVRLAAVQALRRLDAREARDHLHAAAGTEANPDVALAMRTLAADWGGAR